MGRGLPSLQDRSLIGAGLGQAHETLQESSKILEHTLASSAYSYELFWKKPKKVWYAAWKTGK